MGTPSADAVVIGAGPAGCAAALGFALRGRRVLVLEADEPPSRRLAGEWIHPPGVGALRRLGVEVPPSRCATGLGFVVFPEDGSPPISLPYASGETALSCEHAALVTALRSAAARHPGIDLVTGRRVVGVGGTSVHHTGGPAGDAVESMGGWVVGADGRSSRLRRTLGLPGTDVPLSRMAGILLADVTLPFEGYGHIFLGGPGPVLAYRLNRTSVRVCIDVPLSVRARELDALITHRYTPWLPDPLRRELVTALSRGSPRWAANRFRPRAAYGRGRRALVGDAVGHFHPLTAVGMTLALLDGECLARCGTLQEYAAERRAHSRVPELLAEALYGVFTGDDPGTRAIRQAVYEVWRCDPAERARTMRLLAVEETRLSQFAQAFLHVTAVALRQVGGSARAGHGVWEPLRALRGMSGWVGWLGGSAARSLVSRRPRD
ncbi:MAG TPA: FAD-dependent oxidoreductase [Thermomonospora sp.]|nr:FAD-dependent oxidoreductase [Thermomonospora sp.]